MERLAAVKTLLVQQKKEWGEILTGFETKNKYAVNDGSGNQLYFAAEQSALLSRLFWKKWRPFTMHIFSEKSSPVLFLQRPLRFYFHEIKITDFQGTPLGSVRREFSFFTREFSVKNADGDIMYHIHGPFFHPWTFHLQKQNLEVGKISKKWSGMDKEMFTDADNFNITFPEEAIPQEKALLLGALFLIDIMYFERTN